jgi:hypothetical protein|tara:strand:+ start:14943 stop:15083 length:141 start_codon:yes stop_codon:yes gene_type:complete
MGIVEECEEVIYWLDNEARLENKHPIRRKMVTIKATLDAQKMLHIR